MTVPVWTEKDVPGGTVYIIIGGLVMPIVTTSSFTEKDVPTPTYTECEAPMPTYTECTAPMPVWGEKNIT